MDEDVVKRGSDKSYPMDALLKWFMQVIIGVGSEQVSLVPPRWVLGMADHRVAAGMMSWPWNMH